MGTISQNKLMTDLVVGPGGSLNSLDLLPFLCRYLYGLFPEAEEPLIAVKNNRICWDRAHEALLKRGRKGITGNVKDIFRDESIEREVASVARKTGTIR